MRGWRPSRPTDLLLRAMYLEDGLTAAQDRLALLLMQYRGGSRTYDEQRGHPRLRMRHFTFHVGPERDAWLKPMNAAGAAVGLPAAARTRMRDHFHNTASFLMNREN